MEEQVARFVSTETKLPLPPPAGEAGIIGAVRRNLFATPFDAVLTVVAGLFLAYAAFHLFQWAVVDAVFTGADRTACLPSAGGEVGACWTFVSAKFAQFMYGLYPVEERWRVNLCFAGLALLTLGLAVPRLPLKRLNAIALFAVYPFVALVLLTGGRFELSGAALALVMIVAAAATLVMASGRVGFHWGDILARSAGGFLFAAIILLLASAVFDMRQTLFLNLRFTNLSIAAFCAAILSIAATIIAALRSPDQRGQALSLLLPLVAVIILVSFLTANLGLAMVRTNYWGGLMLTLVVAVTGIAASLPLGILLALGRRSQMPAIKLLCVIFIEFWHGVPLITVLFMANFMLALFLPAGVSFDQLLRALVGVALFSAAYVAEVIRRGLQAIPKGQYEGADAMGLTYWQKMRMIILPQALKLVIPGIVNSFIGIFKDTSLVYIIGLADFLGTVRRGFSDPNWLTEATPASGLVFAAFVYWLFCFSMSRYSIYIERRLDTGHKR